MAIFMESIYFQISFSKKFEDYLFVKQPKTSS